jgi:hypothetical protein
LLGGVAAGTGTITARYLKAISAQVICQQKH